MKKSNKSWIRQLSESYIHQALNMNESFDWEKASNHELIKKYFKTHPYVENGTFSLKKIHDVLDQTGPHESAESAVEAIYGPVLAAHPDDRVANKAEDMGNALRGAITDFIRNPNDEKVNYGRFL